ncbi:hypothetical protein PWT90_03409 [Aphanocladium album]|nr:hypothetical protein PWT90_03409 [Aphanocladium album]
MDAAVSAGAANNGAALSTEQQAVPPAPTFTNGVIEAWKARCAKLRDDERQQFESHACLGLPGYLEELAKICQDHRTESRAFRFVDWFEPLYTAVELFMPVATVAIQAYPNPGSLILGGIIAALHATNRLRDYHRRTVQLLAQMGRKAHILQEYETVVYETDSQVQMALVDVYGDIIDFCQNAVGFAAKNAKKIRRVKGFRMLIFRDFEAQLGAFGRAFDIHIEHLENLGWLCDKKRLKDLHDHLNTRYTATGEASADNREQFEHLKASMGQLLKKNREIEMREEQRRKDKHRIALLDWLSSMSFRAAYDQRCDEHLDGTGSWMLNSETYKNWKSSDKSDLLWVKGKPGCGKSVLAAVTITDLKLEMDPDTALGYAFCRRDEDSYQDPTTIFGALAQQVNAQMVTTDPVLDMEFRASHSTAKPSQRAIRLIMASAVKEFKQIYLVIDALDECKDNDQLAEELRDLVENKGLPPVKVIVFSRDEYKIQQHLREYKKIEPDKGENEEDLKAYIMSMFKKSANREIREAFLLKANGMFLWVQLLAKNLAQSPLPDKEKLKLIKEIPPGLDNIYNRILQGICSQVDYSRRTAFLVLLWVMFAWRPLSGAEMLDAVADYSESRKLNDATRYDKAEHLVAICANLVFIDKDGYFRLCHESVRNHLEKLETEQTDPLSQFQKQKQNVQQHLAQICLNYMLLDDFERGAALSLDGLIKFTAKKPFLEYASNWDLHIKVENTSVLQSLIMKCVDSQPRRELSMQFALLGTEDPEACASNLWTFRGTSNRLHLLAICGLKQTAENIPDVASLALQADGSGRTPLTYAMERQNHDIAIWLIDKIKNTPELSIDRAQKLPLIHLAADNGWDDVLESLLCGNEDLINLKMSPDGQTPLGRAATSGRKKAVEMLIRHQANVNLVDGKGDYPLLLAASYGHASVIPILLAHGAEPNCHDALGFGPLHYAADVGNAEIATAILEKNANPLYAGPEDKKKSPLFVAAARNSVDVLKACYKAYPNLVTGMKAENGHNLIHGAAFYNSTKALAYLLDVASRHKDSLTENIEKETALTMAADMGFLESVKILVGAGCDPSILDSKGKNAVHAAARSGKIKIVQCILDKQPRHVSMLLVNQKAHDGETPLHSAVYGENPDIITLLLEHGSNPLVDNTKTTIPSPLHWAAEKGLTNIAAMLLKHTNDASSRSKSGETPLILAAKAGKSHFVSQYLADAASMGLSVDINASTKSGKTALGFSVQTDFESMAILLLQQGALSFRDNDANYPVHHAAWRGYDSALEKLITQEGADKRGYFGRTPLHCAALRGHLSTVKLLAELPTDVLNLPDEEGNTPVYSALLYRHLEVAHYLLDMGADPLVTNNEGNGLLQIAAGIPDLAMARRLLSLGCRGDQQNFFGNTPFSAAVEAGDTEIIDALIASGFNGMDINDVWGNHPHMSAVEQGKFTMIFKLDALGAPWDACNHLGRNSAHAAAPMSHPDVFKFLERRGVDFGHTDIGGYTPLMAAALEGNAAVVSFLLQTQAHSINQQTLFGRDSALSLAAANGFPQSVRILLAAGADPHQRNILGVSPIEYASLHRPCMREMHKARHFHEPENREFRAQTLSTQVCRLSKEIMEHRTNLSTWEIYRRISEACQLSTALIMAGDCEAARMPLMEILWPPKTNMPELTFDCCVCKTEKFPGDKYVCGTCLEWTTLCSTCHTDFETAAGKMPGSLKDVLELEEQMTPVRLALLEITNFGDMVRSLLQWSVGFNWTKVMLDRYEKWEEKYNTTNCFRNLPRPGYELLKLADDSMQYIYSISSIDAAWSSGSTTQIIKLKERYEDYCRKHGFIKDLPDFRCANHKFIAIKEEGVKDAKAAGINLGPDGRMTTAYLQDLIERYSEGSVGSLLSSSQMSNTHPNATRPGGLFRHGSSKSPNSQYSSRGGTPETDPLRNRMPQRSLTVAVRRPSKRLQTPSVKTDVDVAPSSQLFKNSEKIGPIRRVQTLPVAYGNDFAGLLPKSSSGLQSQHGSSVDTSNVGAIMGQATDFYLGLCPEPPSNSHDSIYNSSTPIQNEGASTSTVRDNLAISNGSEEPRPVPANIDRNVPLDITLENRYKNEKAVQEIYLRLFLTRVAYGQAWVDSLDSLAMLASALHVTEAMVPGYTEKYFATLEDEHQLAKETEEALRRSPDSSHGDVDEDEDTASGGSSEDDDDSVDD